MRFVLQRSFGFFTFRFSIIETRRIQSVAWPHLMRGHSLIVINAAKTGKTLTYLPAVCSLAMVRHLQLLSMNISFSQSCVFNSQEYETVVDGDGPVAIIICLDSNAVNDVMKICEKLLKSLGVSVKAFSLHDDENIQVVLKCWFSIPIRHDLIGRFVPILLNRSVNC